MTDATSSPETFDDGVAEIDRWLPQTQCGQCGYPRCELYAKAISQAQAAINQCPPGGHHTIAGLAKLLNKPMVDPDPSFGLHRKRTLAIIDESLCIGCLLCIKACPVDAIIGAAKQMHTVISEECTGCELCLPPCPMDCITLIEHPGFSDNNTSDWAEYRPDQIERARLRANARQKRMDKTEAATKNNAAKPDPKRIRQDIDAAVNRARTKRKLSR